MDWISVKDRLPNVMENVLVYWKNTSQGKEYYEITYYDGDHWYCENEGDGCYIEGEKYHCENFKWRGPQKEE